MKVYITFGQVHTHRVNGKTFDCDSVAVIEAESYAAGRARAFELFEDKWHQCLESAPKMEYFPRGLINVERNMS